jgi:carboxypeptidase C (cathepsin A)
VAGPASEVYSVLDDPSLSLVIGPFAATIQQYIRQDLRYQTNWPYVFLSGEISRMWDWDTGKGGSLNVSPTLTQAMIVNANLRVFMAAGRYDLVTSYFSQQYAAGHLGLPKAVRPHLQLHVYESGHQLYTDPAARAKLHADVGEFFQKR